PDVGPPAEPNVAILIEEEVPEVPGGNRDRHLADLTCRGDVPEHVAAGLVEPNVAVLACVDPIRRAIRRQRELVDGVGQKTAVFERFEPRAGRWGVPDRGGAPALPRSNERHDRGSLVGG